MINFYYSQVPRTVSDWRYRTVSSVCPTAGHVLSVSPFLISPTSTDEVRQRDPFV